MNVAGMLSSDFLNGQELATPVIATIKAVDIKALGEDKEQKVVLAFYELSKELPLNCNRLDLI